MIMKTSRLFFLVVFAWLIGMAGLNAQQVISRTTVAQGEVEGVVEDGLGMFKAIPYAQPPVGNLRWKAPVPAEKWEGVYKTDHYAPMPPQRVWNESAKATKQSEDCLYVNVITPATSKDEALPVMVWIHGGGFITGHYANPIGTNLAKKGVVFVSIAYRTGALGFLALPELSKESGKGISGNYGLMDQILALKWVKQNIAAFGGDPDKVTIFGESAGAIAVSMLCASPQAKGLFRGAISESGGSFCPVADSVYVNNHTIRNIKGAEALGVDFMKRMGAKSLKQLRRMSAESLINDEKTTGISGFWPTVDGVVITDDQYKLYERGEYNDVNILIGTNSNEGTMFVQPTSVANYEALINATFGPAAARALEEYPATNEQEVYTALSDMFRDAGFAWHTYAWAKLQQQTGKGKVYLYYFDQLNRSPRVPDHMRRGAFHADELPYVFGTHPEGSNATEDAVSDVMMDYWVNFVKTGNPNAKGLPYWTEFNEQEASVMEFNNGAHLVKLPNYSKLQLMEEHYKTLRTLSEGK
jgi:para-nitrobenzyl esterase